MKYKRWHCVIMSASILAGSVHCAPVMADPVAFNHVERPSVDLKLSPYSQSRDSGLTSEFQLPDGPSGVVRNVNNYGATPNSPSNDDGLAIQRAIAAADPGDVVYLSDGVYHIKSTIHLKSRVSIVGQSQSGVVLSGVYSSTPHAVIFAPPGVTNLRLSRFSILSSTAHRYDSGIRLGSTGDVVVSRILVEEVLVENHRRFGIHLQNAQHVGVYKSAVRNASALDGGGSGYGIIIDQPLSSNNWIKGNTIGPVIRHGILLQEEAHHNLVEENVVTGAVASGIDLHGEDEYSNEIRYNLVKDCVRNGTSVSPNGGGIEVGEFSGIAGNTDMHDKSGPNNWIHHNEVYGCTYGLRITNNSDFAAIEGNVLRNNSLSGIRADLAPLKDLAIIRNTIYHNGDGVVIVDVSNLTLSNNSIYNNGNGLILMNSRGAILRENLVVNNSARGFWSDIDLAMYTLQGNTVTGNGLNIAVGPIPRSAS